jgi:hypothetical protein
MTVQNHLTPNGSQQRLDSISFGLKGSAKFIFNQGNYALEMKEEKSLLYTTHKRITTKSRTSTEFMGDFGHCINKEISCFIFNRSELYHFFE